MCFQVIILKHFLFKTVNISTENILRLKRKYGITALTNIFSVEKNYNYNLIFIFFKFQIKTI